MAQQDDFAPTVAMADASAQALDIRFTGSGSEYFRIWIVNLLLTLVTLTLYAPFARARRIAYFQNNTLVGGDPLGFHADPWKMFRGYLVVLLLGVGYWAVSNFTPGLTWIALLVFMALWPALWRASLQFRLRNTSWRGVRLSFLGDLKGAYLSMLPFFLPALAFVLFLPEVVDGEEMAPEVARRSGIVFGTVVLVFLALMPWLMARIKRYQHGGYAFARQRTELRAGTGRFYGLFMKTGGVSLLVAFVSGALIALVLFVLARGMFSDMAAVQRRALFTLIVPVALGVIYLLIPLVSTPYFSARFQNLLWNGTSSEKVRFSSALRFRSLFRVTLVNWLLIVVTLGFYWPFAKVRAARLKLESMSLEVDGPVDDWIASAQRADKGVLGDAAGDFFGMDMGL
ncbi:YjgN family protein [Hydrogenophaga laconesensis]|uniref:Uncharacterized membrane protein YjgN (DUF898 family) n=1 Tax=Hydrogenophaga laconesensis TaxID=1805971 RepID=A0ABU1VI31_9BURK|nr:YjgN family protein [Hydrogenophaga laconesensis]MDR7097146.1 uncharacterized membrane protein YjgN (DUF898 family) [Hydrogenophaga laconesensis]